MSEKEGSALLALEGALRQAMINHRNALAQEKRALLRNDYASCVEYRLQADKYWELAAKANHEIDLENAV